MDKLLHRGKYAVENIEVHHVVKRSWVDKMLSIDNEFTKTDKLICYFSVVNLLICWVLFMIGTLLEFTIGLPDKVWLGYWIGQICYNGVLCVFVVVWFTIGCTRDIRRFFKDLGESQVCELDDGTVVDGVDAYEIDKMTALAENQ